MTITIANPTVDRPLIRAFVENFYTAIREHTVIGPIFDKAIEGHWPEHFETLTDFWITVLYGAPAYKGNPFMAHQNLPDLQDAHFDIWLSYFEKAARECLPETLAAKAIDKSARIATSLRQGLFFKPTGPQS